MATLANNHPTLLDFKAGLGPDDKIAPVIEMLSQTNEMLEDAVVLQANGVDSHRTMVRTGIPEPAWRKLYGGVQPSKTTRAAIKEGFGMLEDYAEIDKALADLNGNSAAWRLSEEAGFIEGFAQKLSRYMIYGNEGTEPEAITGFAPRYAQRSAMNGENIILHNDTIPDNADNTSIWVVGWGPNSVHLIYPKGSKAGIQIEDKGQVTIENIDGQNGRMEAYRTHYRWDIGLVVRDWRYVQRIQIDLEDVTKSGATGPVIGDLLAKAMRRMPNMKGVRAGIYMNRDALDRWDLQQNAMPQLHYTTLADAQGKPVDRFRGVPVRRVDQILSTEQGVLA